ncbi:S-adenosylmethionine decarboxylase [Actinokineospora enzanensis]|uniref:S-adenosylmethionine decarboxylase n=1 Tax=Actinokineospora enzanensis TaxID=155975 RepID=UPI0003766B75|nr:S-adenosylmethionine decarboxylase [Actinokineospora enzanensis]
MTEPLTTLLRDLLTDITGDSSMLTAPTDLPLFAGGLGLDSVSGVRLLREVKDRYGVDIAAEDLNLDALASLHTLAAYIADHAHPDRWADGQDHTDLRVAEARTPKWLYVVDGEFAPGSVAADLERLTTACVGAVRDAGGHVLKESHVLFPNGAITLVLILAESHLSVHTWPEENLAAIDLFSCGAIDGLAIVDRLVDALDLRGARVQECERGLQAR